MSVRFLLAAIVALCPVPGGRTVAGEPSYPPPPWHLVDL
jgi:hypothetical protein